LNLLKAKVDQQLKRHEIWDAVVFTLLTALAVLNGQTTIFYIIYFFWWHEFIAILIDGFFMEKRSSLVSNESRSKTSSIGFIMSIYFIFIVVFFGIIANWSNLDISMTNFEILFFKNWFFNLNLLYVIIERVLLNQSEVPIKTSHNAFSANMIVMHISIILGGLLIFLVVNRYPEIFTRTNLWGSVVIISPFLVLRALVKYLTRGDAIATSE
jgi:hypothetical protein